MFAKILKALNNKKYLGISYHDMAECFGVGKSSISNWVNGKKVSTFNVNDRYSGIDKCRKILNYEEKEDEFVEQLIEALEMSDEEKDCLRKVYEDRKKEAMQKKDNYYRQFLLDLLYGKLPEQTQSLQETTVYEGVAQKHRVAIGGKHIIAVKENGHVLTLGENDDQQCATYEWRNVISVGAGWTYSAGLRKDGSCMITGRSMVGDGTVFRWRDVIAIACGTFHMMGLQNDGHVMAYGRAGNGQCAVEDWTEITAIAAGHNHSVGLRKDGTVVSRGKNEQGQCETENWENVIAIAAAGDHTIGLTSNGKILGTGDVSSFSFSEWTDITAIATGYYHVVGLRSDGSVIATGHESGGQCDVWKWHNIVEVAAGAYATAAISASGNVLCTHDPHARSMFYLDTSKWKLFEPIAEAVNHITCYEKVRGEFLELLLLAKDYATQFTINAYPMAIPVGLCPELDEDRKAEVNRFMQELLDVSRRIWNMYQEYEYLKPLADLMFNYSVLFVDFKNSCTEEIREEKNVYKTGEETKSLLNMLNMGIRTIERRLREAKE